MAFSEKLQSYNTFSAEVVTLEPAKQPATRQVVFIPGNPGLPAFYRAFFLHIQNYLGGHVLVSSISQLEHHSLASPSRRPTLDEQLKSKADFVKELKAAHKGLPITVIGHSLGGWMIVEVSVNWRA